MPYGTLPLTSYFAGALDDAPIAFVASTTERDSSRYLKANAAYLQLCGRIWTDIAGRYLVRDGAAMANEDRDRRLWLLENIGRYQDEKALLKHSSGRPISVIMSAHRVAIDGIVVDIEYISSYKADPIGKKVRSDKFPILNCSGISPAEFTPSVKKSLSEMPEETARNLILSMLGTVLRGIMLLAQIAPAGHPVSRFGLQFSLDLLGAGTMPQDDRQVSFGLALLDIDEARQGLLDLATAIWTLARFQKDETKTRLEALVSPYTVPPRPLILR